jgi:hypothetical protein
MSEQKGKVFWKNENVMSHDEFTCFIAINKSVAIPECVDKYEKYILGSGKIIFFRFVDGC